MRAARIRIAGKLDLPAVNSIVAQAVASWVTTERVKRLAVPMHQYRQDDLDHMWLLAAEAADGALLGVAALEDAESADLPGAGPGLLLHGIYVKPGATGAGVGGQLLEAGAGIAGALECAGLLVKAVRQSRGFFERCGLQPLRAESASDYPYRYWLSTSATRSAGGGRHGLRRVPASAAADIS